MENLNATVNRLLQEQTATWTTARGNYAALSHVQVKELRVRGILYKVQFNPARIVSSAAKVDAHSIRERRCFLCPANRPMEQRGIPFGNRYDLLVNPFPIFPRHLTIVDKTHTPQRIASRFGDMLDLAQQLTDYTVFYNGPRCGASAPDHAHFQAGNRGFMPIESEWRHLIANQAATYGKATLWQLNDAPRNTLVMQSPDKADAEQLFSLLCRSLPLPDGEDEPMLNLLALYESDQRTVFIFPRRKHRPDCYYAEGEANLLLSPASVDLGGVFITPVEKDFRKISAADVERILGEVCLSKEDLEGIFKQIKIQEQEPQVQVGILSGAQIAFALTTPYRMGDTEVRGEQVAHYNEGKINWNGKLYNELLFCPCNEAEASFELSDVTIGINFHWERKENQRFAGALKIIAAEGKLTAINIIRVEDYLTSVISSEMSATASLELLKAHAVISRSWLLAQIRKNKEITETGCKQSAFIQNEEELIHWYDREDHHLFDVCADDHCQRYQGITRASTDKVRQAIASTRGQVLTYDGKICDARFSKCCGGALEEFQYCWENQHYPYLTTKRDWKNINLKETEKTSLGTDCTDSHEETYQKNCVYPCNPCLNLKQEAEANCWIRTAPEAFCHTTDKRILAQVLNNYDQETTDYYRWRVTYTQDELAALIRRRSGIDFGSIIDLVPVARGTSGRIWKLKIVGSLRTLVIGKELEIRRTLSPSHLYSSAFVVDKEDVSDEGIPRRFVLSGAGWGHGVGLCQIGAAVMGEQGYSYEQILLHYYTGASIEKWYW
ncbi:MAG: DUF4922 domain-containing protein [Bacteroides sp.]|nr:DUF4922 domain-containing protein [Bacteroides sp.]